MKIMHKEIDSDTKCIRIKANEKIINIQTNPQFDDSLFWALGATLAEIQSFESGLIFLLSGIHDSQGKERFDELLEKHSEKTLGKLISLFIENVKSDHIRNLLIVIRDDRNHVAHNFLRKYGWPCMNEAQYTKAIEELLQIREIIHESEKLITEHIKAQNIIQIFTPEILADLE